MFSIVGASSDKITSRSIPSPTITTLSSNADTSIAVWTINVGCKKLRHLSNNKDFMQITLNKYRFGNINFKSLCLHLSFI